MKAELKDADEPFIGEFGIDLYDGTKIERIVRYDLANSDDCDSMMRGAINDNYELVAAELAIGELGWRTKQAGNFLSGVPYFLTYRSHVLHSSKGQGTLIMTILSAAANDTNWLIAGELNRYLHHLWVQPSPVWEKYDFYKDEE